VDEVDGQLARLEKVMDRRFGDPAAPLFVSVRSGAAVSMPGMMDTVLNLGLTDETLEGLAKGSGSRRFALEATELRKTTDTAFSRHRRCTVSTGPDLLDHPAKIEIEATAVVADGTDDGRSG